MSESEQVTLSGIRPWLPWIIAIVAIVAASTRTEFMVQNHESRLKIIEEAFGPDRRTTFISRRVNMERDISDLQKTVSHLSKTCD